MRNSCEKKLINDIGLERYTHSIRVAKTAEGLGSIYNLDLEKINIASILHDCGKFEDKMTLLKKADEFDIILDNVMKYNLELIHGPLGAKIAEIEYGVGDRKILDAIKYHTTGRENMTMLDKIIYISDYIEPERNFEGVKEVRKLVFRDINKGVLMAMENTIKFLLANHQLIHPDTIKARNQLSILLGKTRGG